MPAPSAASAVYQRLFHKCLTSRVPVDRFESFTRQLFSRSPVSPVSIAAELVSPAVTPISDPLQHQYIQRLVENEFVSLGEVLSALARSSTDLFSSTSSSIYPSDEELQEARRSREEVEAGILLVLAGTVRFQKPKNADSIWTAIAATGKWLQLAMENTRGSLSKEAIAEVVLALGQDEGVMKVWTGLIGAPPSRDLRGPFTTTLTHFAQVLQGESPMISNRLEGLFQYQRSPGQQPGKADMMGLVGGIGAESDVDIIGLADTASRTWARGSGIVWLDSLLVGLPLTDEEAILCYLTSRYRDDTSSMISEFVLAAFDTLATAMNPVHPASSSQTFLIRSFIINKVPQILTRIFLPQDTLNSILSQVLLRIDPTVLSSTSGGPFGGSGDMFSLPQDIRQEFLFALALHGLVEEVSIQEILGELPMMTLPASGRYSSEDLVSQCQLDPERVERLLEELEGLDGNAGAVALAVVEVIRGMCEKKETLSLRSVCGFLTRKPSAIDVIMMFVKPAYFLEPLCVLLDTWRYEEDLGEYQPVYEDFGYILLLILTTIHRYDLPLTVSILGESCDSMDSFIPRLLTKGLIAHRIEDIESADSHAQLGGWIKELFEAEGISDSLMGACRPQDFYMLVPTFFLQSVMAAHRGVLDIDTLKDGFAYLLEPFLMPSLVSALTWLGNYVWENSSAGLEDSLVAPLSIMQSLVNPASALSVEKSMVHQTVLSIAARHLERVVKEVLRSMDHGAQQALQITSLIDGILQAVNPHLQFKRAATASRQELEAWVSNNGAHVPQAGGLVATFKSTIGTLITWSAANYGGNKAAATSGPPWYTHRLIQSISHVFGSRVVISTLLDVIYGLYQQNLPVSANNLATIPTPGGANPVIIDLAIDFAATLVVSPTSVSTTNPAVFSPHSADNSSSSGNGAPTSAPRSSGMSSSPPASRSPQVVTTAPLSLIDALRLEASKIVPLSTSPTPGTTEISLTQSVKSSRATSTRATTKPAKSTTSKPNLPATSKVKLEPRADILTRLAKRVESLLIPYQSQAILPAGTIRAVPVPPPATSIPPTNAVPTAAASSDSINSAIVSGNDDMMLSLGMGFGGMGGIGEGFGGGFMDVDFGSVDGELDLLGEFDASGMDLG